MPESNLYYTSTKRFEIKAFPIFLFVALRPGSTAIVMAGWSVHLTTLFPGRA